ncbi:hypothetical protein HDF16_005768 [Granulicella aggregans]|uniref:Uncharacterized protein n=1 Tax=Granulicella aggregans TaxID=474949 RepID=A0A7W7ZJP7_9BACT|nr:hypothetical protein [Granulicella aggregans]
MENWGINVIIALIGLTVDLTGRHDYLAMVYPLRALIFCIMVVFLIARCEQKSNAAPSLPNHFPSLAEREEARSGEMRSQLVSYDPARWVDDRAIPCDFCVCVGPPPNRAGASRSGQGDLRVGQE